MNDDVGDDCDDDDDGDDHDHSGGGGGGNDGDHCSDSISPLANVRPQEELPRTSPLLSTTETAKPTKHSTVEITEGTSK